MVKDLSIPDQIKKKLLISKYLMTINPNKLLQRLSKINVKEVQSSEPGFWVYAVSSI